MQVQLRFVEQDPATGAAFAPIEGSVELRTQPGSSPGMKGCRAGLCDEHAVDDFCDEVLRHGYEILVGRTSLGRITHTVPV